MIHGLQNNFKEWFVGFEQLKVSFRNYEEERRKYDHYSRKVDKLRQNRVAKAQKNQTETGKEIEKMQRVIFIDIFKYIKIQFFLE